MKEELSSTYQQLKSEIEQWLYTSLFVLFQLKYDILNKEFRHKYKNFD